MAIRSKTVISIVTLLLLLAIGLVAACQVQAGNTAEFYVGEHNVTWQQFSRV